jgi:hypothetical protein
MVPLSAPCGLRRAIERDGARAAAGRTDIRGARHIDHGAGCGTLGGVIERDDACAWCDRMRTPPLARDSDAEKCIARRVESFAVADGNRRSTASGLAAQRVTRLAAMSGSGCRAWGSRSAARVETAISAVAVLMNTRIKGARSAAHNMRCRAWGSCPKTRMPIMHIPGSDVGISAKGA